PLENDFGSKFLWKEERFCLLAGSRGDLTTPSYSPRPSTPLIYSPGPFRNVDCSNCLTGLVVVCCSLHRFCYEKLRSKHCLIQPSGLAQMAIKGNLREVVTTCERSWVQALPWGFSFRSEKEWGLSPKAKIWARLHKESLNSRKSILKAKLADLDGVIDKGKGSDADGHRRREVVRFIQEVEKVDAMKVAQKAKIKWSVKGDENSKYYHERDSVKRISLEQNDGLKREVSNEDIKREVWDCGIDKAPEPDNFTFGFYQRYWDIIGNDVVDAVKWFFFIERPISLIGSLYKVIAKVLADHLFTVLDDIVDEIQSAFVTDRQILDDPFILNEIVPWCKNKKKQSMIFKVDFEKAYDLVRWDFIDDILRRFGFGEKWCKWIQSCLYSSRGSVLVNGSPTKEFQFILVMESLHVSFQRVVDADSNKVKHAAAKIGCLVLKTPFNYLGSRVGDLMSRIQSWHDVIEGMHTRLSKRKLKALSIGGRLTLLKSVLGAIPIYHMSILKVPMKVLQNMESIRARFFNGADVNSKKPSWVRWKSVLATKGVGGLGVSSLFALNRTLMFKWVWRFFSQKNSLWVRVVKALHGEDGKIGNKIQPRYLSTWLNIINEIESLKLHGIDLLGVGILRLKI
nr:RNA-directed DNA polymerase, eukaryota, reverse transcriptase zinc-binding domain protein [Tanacetum cinerariifolium]GEZ14980.1 RNA-directed DNA polymerase, eukaryota, reverse transcriptase zinc-binding domain protein [Tanacetum cinerariifolium]